METMQLWSAQCPSRTVIDVLANKWVLYVLDVLRQSDRPMRFTEVRRSVDGVTQKSLTKVLRTLERDGLVDRRVHATVPVRVEYRLTALGHDIGPLLGEINVWTKRNADSVVASRAAFDAAGPDGTAVSEWTSQQRAFG